MSYWLNNMTREQVADSHRQNRLVIPRDWFGDAFGILSLLIPCGLSTVGALIPTTRFDRPIGVCFSLIFGGLFIYALYCLSTERNLMTIETKLSLDENRQLIVTTFKELGWRISQNNKYVVRAVTDNLVSQTATVLIGANAVFINVLHTGASRGRFPFSFGRNSKKSQQLSDSINKLLSIAKN